MYTLKVCNRCNLDVLFLERKIIFNFNARRWAGVAEKRFCNPGDSVGSPPKCQGQALRVRCAQP